MPNNVQLDLGGRCRVVAYKVQSCTVTCDLYSCRAQGLPCSQCSIMCMQLVCDALSSLVARYLAYHLLVFIGMQCFIGEKRAAVYLRQGVDFSKEVKLKSHWEATRQTLVCLVSSFWSSQSHEILARSKTHRSLTVTFVF